MQLLSERSASDLVISGLRGSLSISMEESDAWERAATPGTLKSIFPVRPEKTRRIGY